MAAFEREQSDATWIAGFVPDRATMENWDRKVGAMVNGDDGGCWAPSTPIVFSNTGTGAGRLIISGPLKVCYGGRLTTLSGARFLLPPGQFEQLAEGHTGRTRALPSSFVDAIVQPPAAAVPDFLALGMQVLGARWRVDLAAAPDSIGDAATVGPFDEQATRTSVELEVHDGATLASVTLTWIARKGTPRARLVRFDMGGEPTPITLTAAGGDPEGWATVPAADASLDVQSAVIACDAGVVVDRSANSYWLQIEEDQTLKAPTFLLRPPARLVSTVNLESLQGTPVIDGVQTNAGDIVLLTAQGDPKENGLWYVFGPSNAFTPVGITSAAAGAGIGSTVYFVSAGVFPAGYVVPVAEGPHAGTLWQATNKADFVGKLGELNRTYLEVAQAFAPFPAAGNTYLSAVTTLTNITDTRWQ